MNNEDIKNALKDAGISNPRVMSATEIFVGNKYMGKKRYEGKIIVEIYTDSFRKAVKVLGELGYRFNQTVGFHGTRRSYLFEKEEKK